MLLTKVMKFMAQNGHIAKYLHEKFICSITNVFTTQQLEERQISRGFRFLANS
jgi:hypothetical protein